MNTNIRYFLAGLIAGVACSLATIMVPQMLNPQSAQAQAPAAADPQTLAVDRDIAIKLAKLADARPTGLDPAVAAKLAKLADSPPAAGESELAKRVDRLADALEAALKDAGGKNSEARLVSDLQTLRSQIELYKIQHNDRPPGVTKDGHFDGALLARQLTSRTNAGGDVGNDARQCPYGPYMTQVPPNVFVNGPASSTVSGGQGPIPADGSSGWYFDTRSGKLYANDGGHVRL